MFSSTEKFDSETFHQILKKFELSMQSVLPPIKNTQRHICLSVDLEEYFHAANLSSVCPISSWHTLPSTVEHNTHKLLDIFDQTNASCTFFVLGAVAKKYPKLIKEVSERGHEIASHGRNHKIAYLQSQKQFYSDIKRSKLILEDIIGVPVRGYRAPNFSITNKNLWAYQSLIEAGYLYDSSLHPVAHARYGNLHRSSSPHSISYKGNILHIYPLSIKKLMSKNAPIAGGAYWRIYPSWILTPLIASQVEPELPPPIFYIHPWEIDTIQPFFPQVPLGLRFRHYYGINTLENKIRKILSSYKSVSIIEGYGVFNSTK